ncbi:MAG: hypothetical protein WCE21_00610 [Candidatus Babeliales bacterium]
MKKICISFLSALLTLPMYGAERPHMAEDCPRHQHTPQQQAIIPIPGRVHLPGGKYLVATYTPYGKVRIKRFLLNGAPDITFGTHGEIIELDMTGIMLTVTPDGGFSLTQAAINHVRTIAYRPNGDINTAIGNNGVIITPR